MKREHIVIERLRHDTRKEMKKAHLHDRFEIYYLVSGERIYFIENQTYIVQPGDLIFIDRHALHKTRDTTLGRHERILLEFSSFFLGSLEAELADAMSRLFISGGRLMRLSSSSKYEIEHLLTDMLKEADEQKDGYELMIRLLLSKIIVKAGRYLDDEHAKSQVTTWYHPVMSRVVPYLHDHFHESLSLDQLASQFDLSKFYFSRLFKQYTGYSVVQYVQLLRVREAQRLLRETGLKVIDVAEQSGFDNIQHFCRVFKQVSGKSPMNYRKKNRHGNFT